MMIVILGNMGTGKTTVASGLSSVISYPNISIDQIRQEIFDRTPRLNESMTIKERKSIIKTELKWERESKQKLIKKCLQSKNLILETLGVSPIYKELIEKYRKKYPNEKIVAFKLVAPVTVLKKRVLKRSKLKGLVPVPQVWKCEWGSCFMSDEDCLIYSLVWADKLKSHFDPYIVSKWNSKENSSKNIIKNIIKYLNSKCKQ